MDKKKKTKKFGKKEQIIFLVLMAIVIIVLATFVVILATKKDETNNEETSENKTVVTAEYNDEIKGDSYVDYYNEKHVFDIEVPYINSENSKKVNKEIEKLYSSFVETYNSCYDLLPDRNAIEEGTRVACSISADYISYELDNIISTLITKSYIDNVIGYEATHYAFNLDKTTGKLLTNKEILDKFEITEEYLNERLEGLYREFSINNNLTYSEEDYQNTMNALNNKKVIFIDEKGLLGVVPKFYFSEVSVKPLTPVITIGL